MPDLAGGDGGDNGPGLVMAPMARTCVEADFEHKLQLANGMAVTSLEAVNGA